MKIQRLLLILFCMINFTRFASQSSSSSLAAKAQDVAKKSTADNRLRNLKMDMNKRLEKKLTYVPSKAETQKTILARKGVLNSINHSLKKIYFDPEAVKISMEHSYQCVLDAYAYLNELTHDIKANATKFIANDFSDESKRLFETQKGLRRVFRTIAKWITSQDKKLWQDRLMLQSGTPGVITPRTEQWLKKNQPDNIKRKNNLILLKLPCIYILRTLNDYDLLEDETFDEIDEDEKEKERIVFSRAYDSSFYSKPNINSAIPLYISN